MTRRGAKQKYREGDWFTVPLEGGTFALGLIARSTKKSHSIFFGYFFGPARASIPSLWDVADLWPADAVWVGMFGDVGLHDGTWRVLGRTPGWDRDTWKMPAFVHKDVLVPGRWVLREYPDEDPGARPVGRRIGEAEAVGLSRDGLANAALVELRLTRLLTEA
ncbi:Imm26 family immunity protein [Amycolatopsis sp. NPDC001319]|uniref:Imm26 family immunity protein n=1 Tax=unclassified Amycolatopsis TaxID=2618356 RepID=UPI003698F71C